MSSEGSDVQLCFIRSFHKVYVQQISRCDSFVNQSFGFKWKKKIEKSLNIAKLVSHISSMENLRFELIMETLQIVCSPLLRLHIFSNGNHLHNRLHD